MANIKLTLNIEDSVIVRAKKYASKQKVSLSRIVENYLAALAEKEKEDIPIAGWVKELKAVKKPTPDFDHKSGYRDHIIGKHKNK
ncbi:MAG: DUF6364 family protein [Flavitalea sp.]